MSDYKYLRFVEFVASNQKDRKWLIEDRTTGKRLGRIRWYPEWQQYCFWGETDAAFTSYALDELSLFIKYDPKAIGEAPTKELRD